MFPAVQLTGSSLPLNAIAVALVALSVAGCSADVTRFNNSSFSRAAQSDGSAGGLSPTSPASGPGAPLIPRPKADLGTGGRLAEVISSGSSAIRVAPGNRPIGLSRRDRQQNAFAKRNGNTISKEVNLKRGNSTAIAQGPPAQAQKAAGTSAADTPDAAPIFQWPVDGKILSHFGPQLNGEKNNGLTIAVPEDTPIKSAEDGVVIYADNGLPGFGNLVLVRHADNYVTVYAHAKELSVMRGDQIKRGDIIAHSGKTGSVSTPQLYFEVRKYSAPVDPLRFLEGRLVAPTAGSRQCSTMPAIEGDADGRRTTPIPQC
jgi:murein DD-endopeptidase MepM/ murein hydrolase activator NlpD